MMIDGDCLEADDKTADRGRRSIQNARDPIEAAIAQLGYVLRYVYHDDANYERAVNEVTDRLRAFPPQRA